MVMIKPNPTLVGERIRKIRTYLGLSMNEFASRIDSNAKSGTVSNWETGKNLPNNKRLKKIADLGGISLDELLYGTVEERAEGILLHEIENQSELFDSIIEYLSLTTDLGDILNGIPVGKEGKPYSGRDAMNLFEEMKFQEAKIFINEHLPQIVNKVDSTSLKSINIDKLDQEIINETHSYIDELLVSQSSSIEGYYRNLLNAWDEIMPSSVWFGDLDSLVKRFKNEGYTDEAAYNKALEMIYEAKMSDVQTEAIQSLKQLWNEYKTKLKN